MNIEKYNKIHNELMNRLENGEITVETAKEVNDLAFDRYLVNRDLQQIAIETAMNETNEICKLFSGIYTESSEDDEEESKIKSLVKKVIESVKEFFKKIRTWIRSMVKKLRGQVTEAWTTHQFREVLDKFQDLVEKADKKGIKKFKFVDIDAVWKTFEKEAAEYYTIMIKFSKAMIISSTQEEIENIPSKIDDIREKYQKERLEIINTKKEYNIRDAKVLYSSLELIRSTKLYGFIDTLDEYNDISDKIEDLLESALNGTLTKDMEEAQKIVKKIPVIQRAVNKTVNGCYSALEKCLTTSVSGINGLSESIFDLA